MEDILQTLCQGLVSVSRVRQPSKGISVSALGLPMLQEGHMMEG